MNDNFIIFSFLMILLNSVFLFFSQKQSINAIVVLAFCLFVSAMLFLFLNFEYIAWIFIIVYIGAIIILFLFSVMILHIKEDLRIYKIDIVYGLNFYSILINFIFFFLFGCSFYKGYQLSNYFDLSFLSKAENFSDFSLHANEFGTNLSMYILHSETELHTLGLVLYTMGAPYLIASSFVLLIGLLGSVSFILLQKKENSESQNNTNQNSKSL